MSACRGLDPRWLATVPAVVLAASYLELMRFHGRWWLWGTVVHESGRLTLLETTLYASHFLGHVPVCLVLALLLAGSFAVLEGGDRGRTGSGRLAGLAVLLGAYLAATVALSVAWFGVHDTLAYVLQERQRAGSYDAGGSWALHLPSTELQLALVPLVAAAAIWLFAGRLRPSLRGAGLVAAAGVSTVAITWLVAGPARLVAVWADPRYLAHSVRELVTFPLLYYPVPLAVWLAALPRRRPRVRPSTATTWILALLAATFLFGLVYQVTASLAAGVDSMSQRPAFAGGVPLGVPYLLASHFFEHVLDAVFFVLVALFADVVRRRTRGCASVGQGGGGGPAELSGPI
jgi:hypothetical protein